MNLVARTLLKVMRIEVLLGIGLVLGVALEVEATENVYDNLPSVTQPSSEELDALTPKPLIKDDYETTAEFEARVAQEKESQKIQITVFIPLNVKYQADEEKYEISACGDYRVSGYENRQEFSGQNAMGATWDWVEVTGRLNVVKVEDCKNVYIPMSLADARALRETITAIGAVTLSSQKPETSGNFYQSPKFGTYLLDKTITYTYEGLLDGVYLGRRDTKETLGFLDFKEQNNDLRATRKVLAAQESNWQISDYRPLVEVTPIYPRRAQSRGITGFCEVEFTVTEAGIVRDPYVTENCSPLGIFERASVKAATKLKYTPHTENGRPTEVSGVRYKFVYEM